MAFKFVARHNLKSGARGGGAAGFNTLSLLSLHGVCHHNGAIWKKPALPATQRATIIFSDMTTQLKDINQTGLNETTSLSN